jgi:hypothetical protein
MKSVFAIVVRLRLKWRHAFHGLFSAVNGIDAYPVEVEVNAGYGDTMMDFRNINVFL